MNPRTRKIHLRKLTIRELTPELADQARGGTILNTKSQGATACTCQISCGGTCAMTCDEMCQ
jgi:hypothetical protein